MYQSDQYQLKGKFEDKMNHVVNLFAFDIGCNGTCGG